MGPELPPIMPLKRADVMVAEFDTELVVLVPECRQAHHLDVGLSLVLDSCDGTTSTTDVVHEIAANTPSTTNEVRQWLAACLATLADLDILSPPEPG